MSAPQDISALLTSRQSKAGRVRFIAVDGHGGSGKSTLANLLSEKLGAEIVRTDDFAGLENPLNWWRLVIERIFEPIGQGAKTLSYPRSKWWDNHFPKPVVDQPVTDVMILEGVGSSRKEFREYITLSIFVDTPKEICLNRGIERDRDTNKPKEEIEALWSEWFAEEEEYFRRDDPKDHADLVIEGTEPFGEQIEF